MTVVGSLNLDRVVEVDRLPAAGATVTAGGYRTGPGGKGLNQAVAAARQGVAVRMVGAVGADDPGRQLLALLRAEGIDGSAVRVATSEPTGLALVTVEAGGANTIVVVAGANAELTPAAARQAVARAPAPDVVLTQLEVPLPVVRAALAAAREVGAIGILNPAPAAGPLPADVLGLAAIVVPNETEARALTGATDPERAAQALVAAGCGTVIVTLGAGGALLADGGALRRLASFPVTATDTTAAGDAYCGTLAAALAGGAPLPEALRRAAAAGGLAATRPGAVDSLPDAEAVRALLG